jgi:hypothetical protein
MKREMRREMRMEMQTELAAMADAWGAALQPVAGTGGSQGGAV